MGDTNFIDRADESPQPAGVPKVGDIVAGKYEVEHVLGTGGMGVVVAARHKQLGERVAIKVLLPTALRDKEAIARFVREARTSVKIKSEHVARVLDIGTLDSGTPYILMEHLEGRDLGQVLKTEGPLPIDEAIDFVLQACVAIAEAHQLGIVHRDLKPSNLFLTSRSDGTALIKVLDFGISKALDVDLAEPRDTNLTDTQSVFGSPAYMSPEQIRSAKNVDYRTDIWSLGVILYELVAGDTPFRAETASGVLAAIAADPPGSLHQAREEAPPGLEDVISRCLVKDVSRRYATVAELAKALAPLAPHGSREHVDRIVRLTTSPTTTGRRALSRPPRRSNPTPAAAFAATEKPWTTGAPQKKPRTVITPILLVLAGLLVAGVVAFSQRTPSPPASTAGPTPTPIPTPTLNPTPTPTPTLTPTPTPTLTPTPTAPAVTASGIRVTRPPPRNATPPRLSATASPPPPPPPPPGTSSVDPTQDSH